LLILRRDGTLAQPLISVVDTPPGGGTPATHVPDGIAFHLGAEEFVVTNNLDGTMTRFDFPDTTTHAPPPNHDLRAAVSEAISWGLGPMAISM
jgi:hypothetical protein